MKHHDDTEGTFRRSGNVQLVLAHSRRTHDGSSRELSAGRDGKPGQWGNAGQTVSRDLLGPIDHPLLLAERAQYIAEGPSQTSRGQDLAYSDSLLVDGM